MIRDVQKKKTNDINVILLKYIIIILSSFITNIEKTYLWTFLGALSQVSSRDESHTLLFEHFQATIIGT